MAALCAQYVPKFQSRSTVIHQGPQRPDGWKPSDQMAADFAGLEMSWLERPCKTALRLTTRAHISAFRQLINTEPPRAKLEQEAYWAPLCEAHVPVVNELIQRYRLATYDYFAYEVSAWDVPVWYVRNDGYGYWAVLLPYKEWDVKPVIIEDEEKPGDPPKFQQFEWTEPSVLATTSSRPSRRAAAFRYASLKAAAIRRLAIWPWPSRHLV